MQRRYFLLTTGQALAFAVAGRTTRTVVSREQQPSQVSSNKLEQRVTIVLQAFDSQGNHRAGTAVDNGSAERMASEVERVGIRPSLEPFALSRVVLQSMNGDATPLLGITNSACSGREFRVEESRF